MGILFIFMIFVLRKTLGKLLDFKVENVEHVPSESDYFSLKINLFHQYFVSILELAKFGVRIFSKDKDFKKINFISFDINFY